MPYKTYRSILGLSQQEVADEIGRSPNFVLKAEDLTFPTPPPALTEFYLKYADELGINRELITASYFSSQRTLRVGFLEDYYPKVIPTNHDPFTFREAWFSQEEASAASHPTQYRLSKGLCLPASVVYGMEIKPMSKTPLVVVTCIDQLILYVASGEYAQAVSYQHDVVQSTLDNLEKIKELLP